MTTLRQLVLTSLLAFSAVALEARSPQEIRPLLIGAAVPDVTVRAADGATVRLRDLTKEKRTALIFYRGGWCPYCSKQLQAIGAAEAKLVELGYQIIALSPDSPEKLSSAEKDGELDYALLSDSDLSAAEAFGIDFTLDPATLSKYSEYGIDLSVASGGANKDRLPVPAVFLVTPSNEISFVHVDPDYRFRISERLLLAAARDGVDFQRE